MGFLIFCQRRKQPTSEYMETSRPQQSQKATQARQSNRRTGNSSRNQLYNEQAVTTKTKCTTMYVHHEAEYIYMDIYGGGADVS
jgi:hypothetical protein